jgi:hypothetical protein
VRADSQPVGDHEEACKTPGDAGQSDASTEVRLAGQRRSEGQHRDPEQDGEERVHPPLHPPDRLRGGEPRGPVVGSCGGPGVHGLLEGDAVHGHVDRDQGRGRGSGGGAEAHERRDCTESLQDAAEHEEPGDHEGCRQELEVMDPHPVAAVGVLGEHGHVGVRGLVVWVEQASGDGQPRAADEQDGGDERSA